MEEIISLLQNPNKMEQLVLKLKTIGEDCTQFQTFKASLDSFNLNKTPKGVHQTTMLQNIFQYSATAECFNSFRLVCKSWQNAVETIRWDLHLQNTFYDGLCQSYRNGRFPPIYAKYVKCFKHFFIQFNPQTLTHWDPISNLLIENMKDLEYFDIYGTHFSPEITTFLFKMLQNSKNSLKEFMHWNAQDISPLPSICLPNLELYGIDFKTDLHIDSFAYFMESFIKNMCPSLKYFCIRKISRAPEILKYLVKHFPNHFVCAPQISVLEHIPLKISHLNIQNLAQYRYVSNIEYLSLDTNLHNPNSFSWNDYQDITTFFPNLKGIVLYDNGYYLNPNMSIQPISSHLKNIWNQRLQYFTSKNIQVLSGSEFKKIESEAEKSACTRYIFLFENF
jgi:hypothetical protein